MTRSARRNQADAAELDTRVFDYGASAELFAGQSKKTRSAFTYNRFDSAAEALRFAMENASPQAMLGACLEVDEVRYNFDQIGTLYRSATYPLQRRSGADPDSRSPSGGSTRS
jgi:hypothetical protein